MKQMTAFERHVLSNGLHVLVHRDPDASFATVNTAYRVGSADEAPDRTGFAHLFEHLMFEGTPEVPDLDRIVHACCGESNAFTSCDLTDYYISVPGNAAATALWLEADRMQHLTLDERTFTAEREVVIEEYHQRFCDPPYADARLLLNGLCYKVHPYRWLPIGSVSHLMQATLDDVRDFHDRFYAPDNAVVTVCGNVRPDKVFNWCEQYFGRIPARRHRRPARPQEPVQTEARTAEVTRDVPADALFMAFHTPGRREGGFAACDMLSDALDAGRSTLFNRRLVEEKKLFSSGWAAVTATEDPGLLLIQGQLSEGVTPEEGCRGIWECLEDLASRPLPDAEMQKLRNWHEATGIMDHLPMQQRAQSLGIYELFAKAEDLHTEHARYAAVTAGALRDAAVRVFRPENACTLFYRAAKK